jgi:hypothetical protein
MKTFKKLIKYLKNPLKKYKMTKKDKEGAELSDPKRFGINTKQRRK